MGEEADAGGPAGTATVIIPTRDRRDLVKDAVRSVLATEGAWLKRLVVVDDGSTDGTTKYLRDLYGEDPRLHFIGNRAPEGRCVARNRGVAEAEGDVLVFLDDDCVAPPGWLAAMLAPFRQPEIVGAAGGIQDELVSGSVVAALLTFARAEPGAGATEPIVHGGNYAVRTSVFSQLGGFDPHLTGLGSEEVDLWLRIQGAGFKTCVLPHVKVLHRGKKSTREDLRTCFGQGRGRAHIRRRLGKRIWPVQLIWDFLLLLLAPFRAIPFVRKKVPLGLALRMAYLKRAQRLAFSLGMAWQVLTTPRPEPYGAAPEARSDP